MKALFEVARKALEDYTSNSLTEKNRRRSINSPLYMRVAFYNTFNDHYNIKGITITKYLGLDHTTGIHYKNIREIILFNDDEYQEQYFKMCLCKFVTMLLLAFPQLHFPKQSTQVPVHD